MAKTKAITKTKAKKEEVVSEKLERELEDAEKEMEEVESFVNGKAVEPEEIKVKASKPAAQLKKGDKIKVDGKQLEVDSHYVLIDHGSTQEMAIELFDSKTDKDYQLRYFSDQVERSLEFYELQEIMYVKKSCKLVEW